MTNVPECAPEELTKGRVWNTALLAYCLYRLKYYGLALVFVAAAAVLRWALPDVLGPTPFLAFYLAWVGAAAFGGLGPGLLATVVSWLCVDLLFDPAGSLINFANPETIGRLAVLLAGGLTVSLIAERMRRGRIHERRQAQGLARAKQEVEEQRSLLDTVVRNLPSGANLIRGRDLTYQLVNPACQAIAPGKEMVGKTLEEVWPELQPRLANLYRQVLATGEPYHAVDEPISVARYPGGPVERAYFSWSLYRVRLPGDEGWGVLNTVWETTDRKQAEEQLRESEARYRFLFENMLDGYAHCQMLFDEQGRPADFVYLDVNDAFGRLTGLKEVVGKKVSAVIPGLREFHPELFEIYGRVAQTGRPERFEIKLKPLGIWLSISVYSYRKGYFTALFDNITARKQAQETLHQANERLQEQAEELQTQREELRVQTEEPGAANAALRESEERLRELTVTLEDKVARRTAELERRARQLQKLTLELSEAEDRERQRLAEILHDDLQQVLAAAKFHLGLLNNRVKHDSSQQAVLAQVDHMLMDAIQKSRSLSHELSPAVLHHSDLGETLHWLAGQVQTKHGLVVHVHPFGQVGTPSDAIRTFLYRAAQELLFNVVKHARVGEARIRVRRVGRYLCLSVSDGGRGFDPQALRETPGFGLLSIRERVELLGGRMKIKSALGRGSSFFIVVPDGQTPKTEDGGQKTEDGRKTDEGAPPSVLRSPSSVLRVLLADDHEIVREGLTALLSEQRMIEVVGAAANGREAVDLANELRPDVVVMDVSMPLMNGDEAARQIKRYLPRTRIVALSMHEQREMVESMRRAGAESYVLKTAPSEELVAAICGRQAAS